MRPGRLSPGILLELLVAYRRSEEIGFNEARAVKPGNTNLVTKSGLEGKITASMRPGRLSPGIPSG